MALAFSRKLGLTTSQPSWYLPPSVGTCYLRRLLVRRQARAIPDMKSPTHMALAEGTSAARKISRRTKGVFHHEPFFCEAYPPPKTSDKSATPKFSQDSIPGFKIRLQLGGFPATTGTRIPNCSTPWSLGRRLIKWVMLLEKSPGSMLRVVNEWHDLNLLSTI